MRPEAASEGEGLDELSSALTSSGFAVSAGVEEVPDLMRMKLGDLGDSLDQYLTGLGEVQKPTVHYGTTRIVFRVVERNTPYNVIAAIALDEWVQANGELDGKLARNVSWTSHSGIGRELVRLYVDRFEDDAGAPSIAIERVQIMPGPLSLDYTEEIEVRSEAIEAIGEWGKSRGVPVYLIRPEVIREQRPDIRERAILFNYYLPVAQKDPRLWDTVQLKLRRSRFTSEGKELSWFRYVGASGLEEQASRAAAELELLLEVPGPKGAGVLLFTDLEGDARSAALSL